MHGLNFVSIPKGRMECVKNLYTRCERSITICKRSKRNASGLNYTQTVWTSCNRSKLHASGQNFMQAVQNFVQAVQTHVSFPIRSKSWNWDRLQKKTSKLWPPPYLLVFCAVIQCIVCSYQVSRDPCSFIYQVSKLLAILIAVTYCSGQSLTLLEVHPP